MKDVRINLLILLKISLAIEIESFCVNCEKNGITKLLLTKIPFFKGNFFILYKNILYNPSL